VGIVRLRSVGALGVALLALAPALLLPSLATAADPTPTSEWFAPASIWNRPLPEASEVVANSAAYVGSLVHQVEEFGPWINTNEYSAPVYRVEADQPRVPVRLEPAEGGGATPTLRAALSSVPLPADAEPAAGTDHHLVVWQPSTDEMWEFWVLRHELDGWVAAFGGAMRNVSENPGFYSPDAWPGAEDDWGATATSLPLLAGLITIEEFRQGHIDHALALAIPEPSAEHVWPAQRSDGFLTEPDAIPEGTEFRLPADLDLSTLGLSPTGLEIAEAAQRYGMIVRDRSGVVSFYGEDPTGGENPYDSIFSGIFPDTLLEKFPWSRLEAIEPDPVAAAGLQLKLPYPLWAAPHP
jgi:hypothetical protein